MAWWPPEVEGDEAGRWLREFVRALFDFPDPRAATSGTIEVGEHEPQDGQAQQED